MRLIVVLFLLLGCTEERIVIYKNCFDMTLPQGNPVKFWLNGVESFNEKVVAGMQQVCFKQKFNSDDVTKIQIYDDSGAAYLLILKDKDGEIVGYESFVEYTDYYTVEIDFADYPDDEFIKLFIVNSSGIEYYLAPSTGWSDDGTYTPFDSKTTTSLVKLATGVSAYAAHQPAVLASGTHPDPLSLQINYSHNVFSSYVWLEYLDSMDNVVSSSQTHEFTADSFLPINFVFSELTGTSNRLRVLFQNGGGLATVYIFIPVGDIILLDADNYAAKSDLLHIADHDDTVLIQYGDKTNYAGIDYSNEDIFAIRLDGRFAKERTPEENESDQTSDGTVEKLSSTLKDQKLLELEYAPPYIHKLMKRVLNHNTIYIDGEYWVKEENYEARDVSNSQPLQPASCWLTQKEDGYNTNVYGTVTTI